MCVVETLAALEADVASGRLAELCARHEVDLLVLHGSARTHPRDAQDVDLAYLPVPGAEPDHMALLVELLSTYGDVVDLMPLHRAAPAPRYGALGRGSVLIEHTPGRFAEAQMAAFREFIDTRRFREAELERLVP